MEPTEKGTPADRGGRGAAVWVEDILIWASLLALWPWLLRGRWIFTGWWVTALLLAALGAMLFVAVRRVRRLLRRSAARAEGGGSTPTGKFHAE